MNISFKDKTLFRNAHRRAFTLTEIAIVLGTVGIIISGIWLAASQVYEKSRLTNAINQFNTVSQNMSNLLQGGFGRTTNPCPSTALCDVTAKMVAAEIIPSAYVVTGSSPATATNPWSGNYDIWWSPNNFASANGIPTYRMSFYNVSLSGCVGLIMSATTCKPGRPGCPVTILAGVTDANNYNLLTQPAMTSATAQTECNHNSYTGGANSIEFDFTN